MNERDQPRFPLRLHWLETGEVEAYDSEDDLLFNLEDFDSGDPASRAEATVTDARGRPVHLVVKIWKNRCEYALE